MSVGGKLIRKVTRLEKYIRKNLRGKKFDRINQIEEVMAESPGAYSVMLDAQRRYDEVFGLDVAGKEPLIAQNIIITSLVPFTFSGGIAGIKATLGAGLIAAFGIRPKDRIQLEEGNLKGQMLEVVSIHSSTELQLENVASFGTAGDAEVTEITAVADVGDFEESTVTCPAGAGASQAEYWKITNVAGNEWLIWYDIDANGTVPSSSEYTTINTAGRAIEVDILSGDANTDVADKTYAAINAAFAAADMTVTDPAGASADVVIEQDYAGNVTDSDAYDEDGGQVGPNFSVAVVDGVDSNLLDSYLTINSASDVVEYYVWFNVDGLGTDPSVAGKTGLEVAISAGDANTAVATAMASVINALDDFAAPAPGAAVVEITNAGPGATTDAADGVAATGFGFSVTTPGTDSTGESNIDGIFEASTVKKATS